MIASARWHSAFQALRKSEVKSAERLEEIKSFLRQHELFKEWENPLLEKIAQAMREQVVREGDTIITQGDEGDNFYLLVEGNCAAYVGETCSQSYSTGDAFGELALLYDTPRAATVRCTSRAALLYSLGRINFRNLISSALLERKIGLERQLLQVPMLKGLSPESVSQLVAALETLDYAQGEYIVEMGTTADALYLILSGEVACHQGGDSELRLAEGAFFGESCLSNARHSSTPLRQANVVAVGPVRCARLPAAHITAILGPLQAAIDRGFVEKVISSITLFDKLTAGERALLLNALTDKTVEAGSVIIEQGSHGDTFYILKSGSVEVSYDPGGGQNSTKLQTMHGGEPTAYFGERSLFKRQATNASVIALEESDLLCLPKETFDSLMMHGAEERSLRTRLMRGTRRSRRSRWRSVREYPGTPWS